MKKKNAFSKVLESYLKRKIGFALFINGVWGSGKTYYFKKKFKEEFEDQIKGKVIYASVNGLKSLDQLKRQIVLNSNSLLRKTENKWFGKSASEVLFSNLAKYGIKLEDYTQLEEGDILIIDDLERRDPSLTMQEIFGFVSVHYTELNFNKVILIADEGKLLDTFTSEYQSNNYPQIKEKTIWRTLEYTTDLERVLPHVLKTYLPSIQSYINEKLEFVLSQCQEYGLSNLRTLTFFLDNLESFSEELIEKIEEDEENVILNSILILSIIYKEGTKLKIKGETKKYLKQNIASLNIGGLFISTEEGPELSDEQKEENRFSMKYVSESKKSYHYFESVVNLIEDGVLDQEKFAIELEEFMSYYDQHKPWVKVYNDFRYPRTFLNDKLFNDNFNSILKFLKEGKYSLDQVCLI